MNKALIILSNNINHGTMIFKELFDEIIKSFETEIIKGLSENEISFLNQKGIKNPTELEQGTFDFVFVYGWNCLHNYYPNISRCSGEKKIFVIIDKLDIIENRKIVEEGTMTEVEYEMKKALELETYTLSDRILVMKQNDYDEINKYTLTQKIDLITHENLTALYSELKG